MKKVDDDRIGVTVARKGHVQVYEMRAMNVSTARNSLALNVAQLHCMLVLQYSNIEPSDPFHCTHCTFTRFETSFILTQQKKIEKRSYEISLYQDASANSAQYCADTLAINWSYTPVRLTLTLLPVV